MLIHVIFILLEDLENESRFTFAYVANWVAVAVDVFNTIFGYVVTNQNQVVLFKAKTLFLNRDFRTSKMEKITTNLKNINQQFWTYLLPTSATCIDVLGGSRDVEG